jgi:hypothetical protein
MPELVELHEKVAARGVRVEAVSLDLVDSAQVKSAEQLGAFVQRHGFTLPVVAFQGDEAALTRDWNLPGGPPYTLAFDKDGKEIGRIEGSATREELEALVEKGLGK